MADREGRLEDRPGRIKMELFPADAKVSVDGLLDELGRVGLIRQYDGPDGAPYLVIPSFNRWQRPHPREASSTLPPPPDANAPAVPFHGEPGDSTASPSVYGNPVYGIGSPEDYRSSKNDDSGRPVDQVFDAYLSTLERPGLYVRTPKRRQLILSALKLYPLEDVLAAVVGWKLSPHHRGENDRKTVYNALELILRDAQHIEMFRDLTRRPRVVGRTDGYADAPRFGPSALSAAYQAMDRAHSDEEKAAARDAILAAQEAAGMVAHA